MVMYSHYQLMNTVLQRGVKDFALFLKMINLLSSKSAGIQGIFLPFKILFNRVQYHLGLVDGSDNLFEIFL